MLSLSVIKEDEVKPQTRCGYDPYEAIKEFNKSLSQAGAMNTGRALHFAADIVTSGGIDAFIKTLWDFALSHIGLASPRIFIYLKKRIEEIQELLKRLPDEDAYKTEEFQVRIGELVLVIRDAPTKTMIAWPKVGAETHYDGWISAAVAYP